MAQIASPWEKILNSPGSCELDFVQKEGLCTYTSERVDGHEEQGGTRPQKRRHSGRDMGDSEAEAQPQAADG